jgi:nucleoside-diphosphate-sugar epimerase
MQPVNGDMGDGTVLVSGASSQIGVFILPRLLEAGFTVLALSRQAPETPVELSERLAWLRPGHRLENSASALVSCGPARLARQLLERHESISRAVVFSSSSVLSKADSPHPAERAVVTEIAREEHILRKFGEDCGMDLTLIRPTLIYGCGLDRNISLLYRIAQRYRVLPLSTAADGLRQPVHADDLAELAVRALEQSGQGILEGQACGGETLTYREMAGRIAACVPGRARLLPLPPWMLASLVGMWSLAKRRQGINRQMVRRQAVDLVFDDRVFRDSLGYGPRCFQPAPSDFDIPDQLRKHRLTV